MRTVFNEDLNRPIRVPDCHLCDDRRRISVPGQGVQWDRDHGCWFDLLGCFSVPCPVCSPESFAAGSYRRETWAFLADWAAQQGGESHMMSEDRRRAIARFAFEAADRATERSRWYVHA